MRQRALTILFHRTFLHQAKLHSRYLSEGIREGYHPCQNINCSCTSVTFESIQRQIVAP
ncbi:ogr/Delta-like zinc finger family protein [Serratia sp. L9]|uniref:ogr/Delta-like zinc finger family protein n=1 Tax=Serratia sp. L9 TaxID=3423946 RepID=UPI003D6696AA